MALWQNADGLTVRTGRDEAAVAKGGEYNSLGALQCIEAKINYTDLLSATATIFGSASTLPGVGSLGVEIPKGARIEKMEFLVEEAFTSSGTIGSATFVSGLIRNDRTTAYTANGFTTTSATGTALGLATVGSLTTVTIGSTGVGAYVGTTLANKGWLVLANSAHASHPYTAGKLVMRVYFYFPQTLG
jgi:hypothetical protein